MTNPLTYTYPKLIIVRGLPGSGKSTFANLMTKYYHHVEADQFWGKDYAFDITRLGKAHEWCLKTVYSLLIADNNKGVCVANTFTTKRELKPYFDIAKELKLVPQVILCQGNYGNIHNVPDTVLDKMKIRFEYNISELYETLLPTV